MNREGEGVKPKDPFLSHGSSRVTCSSSTEDGCPMNNVGNDEKVIDPRFTPHALTPSLYDLPLTIL